MKKYLVNILAVSLLAVLSSCGNKPQSPSEDLSSEDDVTSEIDVSSKEDVTSSEEITTSSEDTHPKIDNQLYTDSGLKVYFNAKGARIEKITWGSKQIAKDGFTVGRCANRIAGGKCTIDGVEYQLTKNNNGNHLHGGGSSWQGPFANATWTKVEQTAYSITYSIHDAAGKEGYPGNMDMTVKYTLNEEGELSIEYKATTDATTLCNPTNHLFIAINGNNSYSNINLQISADNYTPLVNSLPTGAISPVAGTQFDYREEKAFDGSNYDDNLVLNGTGYRKVASMKGTSLKMQVDVYTDRPGLQLYKDGSGNICLETQMFPDMINHPEFDEYGTVLLRPGEEFNSKTTYHFHEIKA